MLAEEEIDRIFLAGFGAAVNILTHRSSRTLGAAGKSAELRGGSLSAKLFFNQSLVSNAGSQPEIGISLKVHRTANFHARVLAPALPVITNAGRRIEVPIDQFRFGFLFRVIAEVGAFVVRVGATSETHLGAIVARSALAICAVIIMAAVHVVRKVIAKSVASAIESARRAVIEARRSDQRRVEIGRGVSKAATRSRSQNLKSKSRLFVDLKAAINSRELVVLLDKIITCGQEANARLLTNVALEPHDRDVGVLVEEAKVHRILSLVADKISRRVIAGHQNPKRVAPALAGKLDGHIRVESGYASFNVDRQLITKRSQAMESSCAISNSGASHRLDRASR